MASAILLSPYGVSPKFGVNVVASTGYTISCAVTASGVVTNEPILRCETAYGVSTSSDTAADSENGPETISLSVTPTANGVLEFWIENPDGTVTITVEDIQAVET